MSCKIAVLGIMYPKASSHICFSYSVLAIRMNFLFVVRRMNFRDGLEHTLFDKSKFREINDELFL